jgi:hypothetical protein
MRASTASSLPIFSSPSIAMGSTSCFAHTRARAQIPVFRPSVESA